MAGIINTGIGYQNRALSGMIRQSALEKKLKEANESLEAAEAQQKSQLTSSSMMGGATMGYAAGAGSAALEGVVGGSWAGPVGAAAGAALGFLFSRLF